MAKNDLYYCDREGHFFTTIVLIQIEDTSLPPRGFLFHILSFSSFITGFHRFYNSNLPHKNANFFIHMIRVSNLSDRHGSQTDRQTDRKTDGNLLGYEHMFRRYFIGLLLYSDSKSL